MTSSDAHNGIVSQKGQVFFASLSYLFIIYYNIIIIIIMNFIFVICQMNKMSHRLSTKLKLHSS